MPKDQGMYPNAHPTAPGGMRQDDLATELINKHRWPDLKVYEWRNSNGKGWRRGSWPEMIEAVCQERLAREKENKMSQPLFIGMPDTHDYVFDGHAGASPSGAERWMKCTASLKASRSFLETLSPNQQREFASGSTAARQGTTAHAVGETEIRVLLGEIEQREADNRLMDLALSPPDGEEYDDDMAEHVSVYVDYVKQYIDSGYDVQIEQRLEAAVGLVGEYEDEVHVIHGSGDCVVMPEVDEPVIHVIDYKHGEGLDVDVESNPQVRIYALGALALLVDEEGNLTTDVETIQYHIVQPRTTGIKVWEESLDDLLTWRDEVLAPALTAALYDTEETAFNPSDDTCQWCPAKGACAASAEQRIESGRELFDTMLEEEIETGEPGSFPETGLLSDERLGTLLTQANSIVKIQEVLKAEAQRRLHRGVEVPGFRLVNYQPPQVWTDKAAKALRGEDDLWIQPEPSLLSPTQALVAAKGDDERTERIKEFIHKPDRKPVISSGPNDKRSAWEGKPPESMFEIEGD